MDDIEDLMKLKVELIFPGELKDEPIICNLGRDYNIVFSIVEASFSSEIGYATLVLKGQESDLHKAFEYLRSREVTINQISER